MRTIFFALISFFLICSCEEDKKSLAIGIDPTFSHLELYDMKPYVYGYIQEILLEISIRKKTKFVLTKANEFAIFKDLNEKKLSAVFSSKKINFLDKKKYFFSNLILETGPAFVTKKDFKYENIESFNKKIVGIEEGNRDVSILEKYRDIIIREYPSKRRVLEDVENGYLDAAFIDCIIGRNLVKNIYGDNLKITDPITKDGIFLISKNSQIIELFNKEIEKLNEEGFLKKIEKKWDLD